MFWGPVIGGALSAASSLFGGGKAARAAKQAAALQWKQYEQSRADLAPWREAGGNALAALAANYGLAGPGAQANAMAGFMASPDYGFRFDEGVRALDASAASRGMLLSGAQAKAVTGFGQTLAAQEYANYLSRLMAMAGIGQAATEQTGQWGANAAANAGSMLYDAGQARAGGYMRAGNALGGNAFAAAIDPFLGMFLPTPPQA